METFSVIFYERTNGSMPAKEFLDSLTEKQLAKTIRDLQLLSDYGHLLREPNSKYLTEGIFELRTKQGSDISRILYFFFNGKRIVLTNGFIKKTTKIPKKELELALKYKRDFEERSC